VEHREFRGIRWREGSVCPFVGFVSVCFVWRAMIDSDNSTTLMSDSNSLAGTYLPIPLQGKLALITGAT